MSNFTKTESGRSLTLAMQALKRIGQPSDVADVIAFIASDGALDHRREYSGGRRIKTRSQMKQWHEHRSNRKGEMPCM